MDDEVDELDRRIARLERIENPVSVGCGLALAVPYAVWMLMHGVYIRYSWMIPLFVGGAISKFTFSIVETRLDRRRRALANPALPEARLLPARSEPAPPPARAPIAAIAPEPAPAPPSPGEEPRLLK